MPSSRPHQVDRLLQNIFGAGIASLLLVFASSALGLFLSRESGSMAAIWLANGVLLSLLLSAPTSRWIALMGAGYYANFVAMAISGGPLASSAVLSGCHAVEVLIAAVLVRRASGARVDLTQWRAARAFAAFAIGLGPVISAALAATYLNFAQGLALQPTFWAWFAADALGTGIITPLALALVQHAGSIRRPAVLRDWLAPLALLIICLGVFGWGSASTGFLVLPPLMIVVFRHGHFGAVSGIGLIVAVSVPSTLLGHGPFVVGMGGIAHGEIILLQVFIATSSLLALGAAMVLQQRAEMSEKLRQTEQALRTVTDNVPALIAHVDAQERFVFINHFKDQLYGLDPDSSLGRSVREVVGEEVYAELQPYVEQVRAGTPVHFERSMPAASGLRHHQISYIPAFGPDGEPSGFYATTVDVTDIKYAELRIARSERWLQNIADNIPSVVAYVGRNERIAFANRRFADEFGLDPSDLIGQSLLECLGAETHAMLAEHLQAIFAGKRVRFEYSVRRATQDAHYLIDWAPDFDPSGKMIGFFSAITNITTRKLTELQQAASEAQIRTMTDGLPGLIAYLDRNGIIRFCNRAYENWFGLAPAEMIGRTMDDALGKILMQSQATFIARALEDERVETEFDAEAKGRCRSLQATYLPHRDESGRVLGVYTLASDVTPLKRMQGELQQMARYDTLTGLANRGEFNARLAKSLTYSAEAGKPLALMFIDVDFFKQVNDTYGHATGDAVLQEVAGRLKGSIGPGDTVARLSGDEFVLIVERPEGPHSAHYLAREILSAMSAPIIFGDAELTVGLSIGIAFNQDNSMDAGALLANADKALYRAKAAGRGTYNVFEPERPAKRGKIPMTG